MIKEKSEKLPLNKFEKTLIAGSLALITPAIIKGCCDYSNIDLSNSIDYSLLAISPLIHTIIPAGVSYMISNTFSGPNQSYESWKETTKNSLKYGVKGFGVGVIGTIIGYGLGQGLGYSLDKLL